MGKSPDAFAGQDAGLAADDVAAHDADICCRQIGQDAGKGNVTAALLDVRYVAGEQRSALLDNVARLNEERACRIGIDIGIRTQHNFYVVRRVQNDNGMMSRGNVGNQAVTRRGDSALGRDNRDAVAQHAGAEIHVVRGFDRHAFAGCRCDEIVDGSSHKNPLFLVKKKYVIGILWCLFWCKMSFAQMTYLFNR